VIQEQLRQVGLTIDLVSVDVATLNQRIPAGDFDAFIRGVLYDTFEPASDFWLSSGQFHIWNPGQKTPATPWEAEIDRLMKKQSTTTDLAEQRQTFAEAQRILAEHQPVIYFAAPKLTVPASARLRGAAASVLALPVLWNADVLTGRIHLGPTLDYMERAFDEAKYGAYSTAPWLEATLPSILDPSLAPTGAHVMSIYAHYAPFVLRSGDWRAEADGLLRAVMGTLEYFAPGIGALVIAAQTITPEQMDREYGFHGGHGFHGELALDQLFTMRPLLGNGRYDAPIAGLHLCGGGTHPGGFMSAASGRLAARVLTGL
jgi:phytoene dehydrogenase-like protein